MTGIHRVYFQLTITVPILKLPFTNLTSVQLHPNSDVLALSPSNPDEVRILRGYCCLCFSTYLYLLLSPAKQVFAQSKQLDSFVGGVRRSFNTFRVAG